MGGAKNNLLNFLELLFIINFWKYGEGVKLIKEGGPKKWIFHGEIFY
jgi:hypothetical protein